MMARALPTATYRLQLTPDFGFDAAADIVPYLKRLGVSHVYASPFLKARAGSRHGYDIVDFGELNPELGGEPAFARLRRALEAAGLGLILDFVPNHMGVGFADNEWWLDVLEWGPRARHARYFDIDWDRYSRAQVLLPILGRTYADALAEAEISLRFDAGAGTFSAFYFDHRLPIAPGAYAFILRRVAESMETVRVQRELWALANLPAVGFDEASKLKGLLAEAAEAIPIATHLAAFDPHTEIGRRALDALLATQHYRLDHWRNAAGINYRRFFDVTTLAGIRVEDPEVFDAVHRRVARSIREGEIDGLRLDHVDGLSDPAGYFERLDALAAAAPERPFYRVVEKILGEGETLPRFAGVSGTTGYEWLNLLSRLFVDPAGLRSLDRSWRRRGGEAFDALLQSAKRYVMEVMLAGEFEALCRLLADCAQGGFPPARLREALCRYVMAFPVYRTYVASGRVSGADRRLIQATLDRIEKSSGEEPLFRALHTALLTDRFAGRLQQFTGPMTAKALEDTSFYRFHRLIALNEVGGDPVAAPVDAGGFHAAMAARLARGDHGLTATATHDTKRGEDARTRILALSELADEWEGAVAEWEAVNRAHLVEHAGRRIPSRRHEYMLYQAMIGGWPGTHPDGGFCERLEGFAVKAAREGKEETSWIEPDEAYEAGLKLFIRRMLDPANAAFLASFGAFAQRTALIGALHSLVQLTLKATMPGVPDFYQGTEFWDLAFVDPDNRRDVDFGARRLALEGPQEDGWTALTETWPDGRIKLALTRALLAIRQEHADLWAEGGHQALVVRGPDASHVVAFGRQLGDEILIIAAGRRLGRLSDGGRRWPGGWQGELPLPAGEATDLLTGRTLASNGRVPLRSLFSTLPVAIIRPGVESRRTHAEPAAQSSRFPGETAEERHMDNRDEKVRKRAYELWQAEGEPEGRDVEFWDLASELIAIEESQKTAMKKVEPPGPYGEPIESAEIAANTGELPTLTDQGEQQYPKPRKRTARKPRAGG